MVKPKDVLVIGIVAALAGGLALGFLGHIHPAGDSLAVFRLPLAAVFGLIVVWTGWPRWLRWPLAVVSLGLMGQIVALKYTTHLPGAVKIYQKNLLFENDDVEAVLRDIVATAPDIVALQEVTSRNAALLRRLRETHPYQASCALTSWARVAIASRWPVEGEVCIENKGLIGLQVVSPDETFWAFSLHAFWPWPHEQADQFEDVLPVLAAVEDPLVLAGDFNMVPWAHALQEVANVTDTRRAGPLFPTLEKAGAPLPIDHVYAPGGGRATARPRAGSDHQGVFAEVFVFE